jgi:ABC-type dipeptide/oligopeptide/nickel transport system permease subunit
MVAMVVAYFASFTMIGQPDSAAAKAISYFPLTAPMAMPGRIAMGATAWWEPVAAAMLTLAATAGLVHLAGRVYTGAILHSGPALSLRDVWRGWTRTATPGTDLAGHRMVMAALTGAGVVLGVAVAVFTHDVIIGVTAGAGFIAIATRMVRLWSRHTGPPVAHR